MAKVPKVRHPPITHAAELLAFSGEHLDYEIRMFLLAVGAGTAVVAVTDGRLLLLLRNARVEMFANHLRNLIAFLYPDQYPPKRSDVVAIDFFASQPEADAWLQRRPALSSSLREAKRRADQEMAHLTAARIAAGCMEKEWAIGPLSGELVPLLQAFSRAADPARLDRRILALVGC